MKRVPSSFKSEAHKPNKRLDYSPRASAGIQGVAKILERFQGTLALSHH